MPIGDFPILEVIIRQLAHYGFSHITLAVSHQSEIIKAFFSDGSRWNTCIDYSFEDKPLSTIAPLKLINDLPEHFLLLNGDILTDLDFGSFHDRHVKEDRLFTIAAYKRTNQVDYGILQVDGKGYLSGFEEKPTHTYIVSMGIYMVNRRILTYVPENQFYGFDHLMADLLKMREAVWVEKMDNYWLDIGRPDDYMRAVDEFEKLKHKFLL
jgi:NDP-sugar pyrophosphorylase family protein